MTFLCFDRELRMFGYSNEKGKCYYFQTSFNKTHFLKNSSNIMMKNQPDPEIKCIIDCWLWMLPFGQKIPLPLSPEFISRPFCLCVSLGLSSPFCFPSVHILFPVPLSALIPFFTFVAPSPSWPLPLSEYERLKFYWCFVKQCYRQVWLLNISC